MTKQKTPSAVPCPVCGALMFPLPGVEVYTGRWWELIRSGETTCPVCIVAVERKRKEEKLRDFQKRFVAAYNAQECADSVARESVLKPEHFMPFEYKPIHVKMTVRT